MAVVLGRKPGGTGGGGGPPSGAAGGDLSGTYPNPALSVAKQAELDGKIPKSLIDAKGDLIAGSAADTAARLAVGATNGMELQVASGESTGLKWAFPPGFELAYVQATGPVTVSGTSGARTSVVSAGAITYDGAPVLVHFFAPAASAGASDQIQVVIEEGGTVLGIIATAGTPSANQQVNGWYRFTPSAASHTYDIKAYRTTNNGTISAGAGGAGTHLPLFVRITKA